MRTIYCDGSGNTEVCIICVYAEDYQEGRRGFIQMKAYFNITNNEAEFLAVLEALKMDLERPIKIITDSKLVVESLNRNWNLRKDQLVYYRDECFKYADDVIFEWIGRDDNRAGIILDRYSKSNGMKKFIKYLDATANKEIDNAIITIRFEPK